MVLFIIVITKDTTFKIAVGGIVFSSLFDTGTQVRCIKYDIVVTLGLLSQISDNNISIRIPSSFCHKFIVYEGFTRPFILGEEFL